MLYYLYDKWTYEIKKKAPLSSLAFINMLGLYFKKRRTADRTEWFGVDNNILQHLPPEKQQSIKQARQNKYDKKKGSKKKQE
jgi:hypothetical protein